MKKEIIGFVFFINVFNSPIVAANLHNVPGHAEKSFKFNYPGRLFYKWEILNKDNLCAVFFVWNNKSLAVKEVETIGLARFISYQFPYTQFLSPNIEF